MVAFYSSARSLQVGPALAVIAFTSVAANLIAISGGVLVFHDSIGAGAPQIVGRVLAFCMVIAGAALMPGALFLSGAIVLYGLGGLDPIQLAAAAGAHLLIGWIYIIAGVLALPRHPEAGLKNPFVPPTSSNAGADARGP